MHSFHALSSIIGGSMRAGELHGFDLYVSLGPETRDGEQVEAKLCHSAQHVVLH